MASDEDDLIADMADVDPRRAMRRVKENKSTALALARPARPAAGAYFDADMLREMTEKALADGASKKEQAQDAQAEKILLKLAERAAKEAVKGKNKALVMRLEADKHFDEKKGPTSNYTGRAPPHASNLVGVAKNVWDRLEASRAKAAIVQDNDGGYSSYWKMEVTW